MEKSRSHWPFSLPPRGPFLEVVPLYPCRPTLWDPVGPVLEIEDRGDHGRLEDQRQLGGSKDLMAEEAEETRQLGSQTKFKRQQEYETLNSSWKQSVIKVHCENFIGWIANINARIYALRFIYWKGHMNNALIVYFGGWLGGQNTKSAYLLSVEYVHVLFGRTKWTQNLYSEDQNWFQGPGAAGFSHTPGTL